MKKLNLLLIIILSSFNVFSQVKTNSEEQIKIEQYECMFPKNFIFTSKDEKGYNVTKNFTVEAATLTYKANKLISFTLKSNSRAQVTYPVEKMISESSRVKQFWIDRNEKYFVVLSFPVDIDNGMGITFISNINGSTMFDFIFQKILTEKEKKEQEILEAQEKKERIEQEKVDIEKIKEVLSEVNIEEKVSQIKTEIEEHYKSMLKDKMTNISVRELLPLQNNYTTNASIRGKFVLHIDALKNIHIIKKDVDCILSDYRVISDNEDKIFHKEVFKLRDEYADEYEIDNHTYYKFKNNIFTNDYKLNKEFTIETKILGVNFKNGKFKYYTNENTIPRMINNWCSENIKTNGLYFINYIMIDDELTCRILNLDRQTKEYLKQRFKIGLMNRY